MAPILTPEDVVRRIATPCTFIDERGAVGFRLEPAATGTTQRQAVEMPVPAPTQPSPL
jgi:hypothetical protein